MIPALLLLAAAAAQPLPEWDALFDREDGWSGADAVYSVPLDDTTTLWLFGDTFLDRYGPKPKMINNTVAVQRGREVDFYTGPGRTSFFAAPAEKDYWWPGDAELVGETLFVFLHQITTAAGGGAFGFRQVGSAVARVDNPRDTPDAWRITITTLPWFDGNDNGELAFGAATLLREDTLYVYGADGRAKKGVKSCVLARVPKNRVTDTKAWEFLGPGGWQPKPDRLRPLFEGAASEFTVTEHDGTLVLVGNDAWLSPVVQARTADKPEGPWSKPQDLFKAPEVGWDKTFFAYAGKAHPQLSEKGELVISYAVNSTDFGKAVRDRRIYRPRFVRIRPFPKR